MTSCPWRVSVATIERDGPFSAFPEWRRRTILVGGAGIRLGTAMVTPDTPDTTYPGDPPPFCTLIDGPVRVLNVFVAPDRSASVTRVSVAAATTLGRDSATTVALCLGEGLRYGGDTLGEFDSIHAPGPLTVTGSGTMLVASL